MPCKDATLLPCFSAQQRSCHSAGVVIFQVDCSDGWETVQMVGNCSDGWDINKHVFGNMYIYKSDVSPASV